MTHWLAYVNCSGCPDDEPLFAYGNETAYFPRRHLINDEFKGGGWHNFGDILHPIHEVGEKQHNLRMNKRSKEMLGEFVVGFQDKDMFMDPNFALDEHLYSDMSLYSVAVGT